MAPPLTPFAQDMTMLRTAVLLLPLVFAGPAQAAPAAELWERWAGHDPDSQTTVDHREFERFLLSRAYINNWRGVEIDDEGRLVASKIYDWPLNVAPWSK